MKSIAVSSLTRARRTAEIVNRDLGLAVTPYDSLREFDVGPYEGSTDGSWLEHWFADGAVEGPESFGDFRKRVLGGMIEALTLEHPVLIVAHGGVFWALQRMLGFAALTHAPNAVVAHFEPGHRRRHLADHAAGERGSAHRHHGLGHHGLGHHGLGHHGLGRETSR